MAELKERRNLKNPWQEARKLIWEQRKRLGIGLMLVLVSRLAALILPASSKFLIDEVIAKGRGDLLPILGLAVGMGLLIEAGSSFALSQILGIAAQRKIADFRKRTQNHIMRLPIRFFDSTQTGVLISRIMHDADGVRNLVGTGLANWSGSLITSVVALGLLFYLSWWITVINLIILAAFGVMVTNAFQRLRPVYRERSVINAQVTGRLSEALSGIRIVKAYVTEKHEERIFAQGAHRLFRKTRTAMTGVSLNTSLGIVAVGTIEGVTFLLGTLSVLRGGMTLGDLFMTVALIRLLAEPVVLLAQIGTQFTEAFAGLDRIGEVNRIATEDEDDERRMPMPAVRGDIEFENVSFEYTLGVPVLKNVSFRAPAGSTTALVGSSGAGKSTLMGLLMAFDRPGSGRLLIDGLDLAEVRLRDYRSQLGVVLQDNFIFDGTILENIQYARRRATFAEVEAVSRIAHCDEFIERFPEGYQTIVGERGVKLSGGQRQRVAIARALLADPRILILDEATSSLDSESEAMIQDGLWTLRRGRTTVVIAHRLSTIQSADQILVLEAGEIVERGTHEELLERSGRYRHLYDVQYRLERNRFINPGEDFTPEPKKRPRPAATTATDACLPS